MEVHLLACRGRPVEPPRASRKAAWIPDGGETWRPAVVIPRDGGGNKRQFDVIALYPDNAEPGTAVSLQAVAWDADGNRIEQQLTDAFELSSR